MLKEISLSVSNEAGELSKILNVLKVVNIQAYSIEAGERNKVRLIVSDTNAAMYQLQIAGYDEKANTLQTLPVLGVELSHKAGQLFRVADCLGKAKVNIEHSFLTVELPERKAIVIVQTKDSDKEKAESILKRQGFKLCDGIDESLESLASPLPDEMNIFPGRDGDKLLKLIKMGESAFVEFKGSMRYDKITGGIKRELGQVICESITAFMNTNGGTLVVGVNDNGDVVGLDEDFSTLGKQKNEDAFLMAYSDLITTWGLIEYSSLTDYYFATIGSDQKVFVVEVQKSKNGPVWFGKEDFWVRVGSSKRKLPPRTALTYIWHRWPRTKRPTG